MKKDLVKLIASVFTMCFLLLICAYYSNAAIGKNGSGETVCRAATPSDADTTESTGTENTEDSGQNDTTENTTEATTGQEETTADGTVTDENGKPVLTEYVTDEHGNQVTDENGKPVTTEVATDENGNPIISTEHTIKIDPEEIKKIQDQQELYKEDLESAKTLIDKLKGSQKSFLEQIEEIDRLLITCETNMMQLKEVKEQYEEYIIQTSKELDEIQVEIDERYEKMKNHIRDAYESGQVNVIDAILFSVDLIDVLNRTEYMDQVRLYDQNILQTYLDKKKKLSIQRTLQTTLRDAIVSVGEDYNTEYEAVQLLLAEKKRQVEGFDNAIDPMQQEADKIEQMYNELDLKIASYEAAASGGAYVSVDGKIIIPSIEGKGGLVWPMPSSYDITSYFGYRNAPTAGASYYHRGIDISCSMGSHVISAMDGTVIYTGYMGSGGITVMVDHGGGVSTVYHHLSSYAVKEGDVVKKGQLIAFSGSTGVSTGPHLHFGVRINGEYTDPLQFYR